MIEKERRINKEIYDRAQERGGGIAYDDMREVFTVSELYGYGVYGTRVYEKDGNYYVRFSIGESCD